MKKAQMRMIKPIRCMNSTPKTYSLRGERDQGVLKALNQVVAALGPSRGPSAPDWRGHRSSHHPLWIVMERRISRLIRPQRLSPNTKRPGRGRKPSLTLDRSGVLWLILQRTSRAKLLATWKMLRPYSTKTKPSWQNFLNITRLHLQATGRMHR